MAYMIMRRGPKPGKLYRLEANEIRIGRGTKNDIIIHDNEVSRNHALLKQATGAYELQDLNSSNGTYVNGQEVLTPWLLRTQCIIEMGDSITFDFYPGMPDDSVPDLDTKDLVAPSTEQMYLVVHTESQDEPAIYPLDGTSIKVGRSTTCHVVVIEPEISREHFVLSRSPQGYTVEDLSSTNGIVINGEPADGTQLVTTQDTIQIGRSIRFQLTEKPESYANMIRTSLLVDTKELEDSSGRARTGPRSTQEMTILSPSQSPSDIGTGVDDVNLNEQILITYARSEWSKIVAPMVDQLYEAGIGVWVDQYLTEGSSDWVIATEQARLECWLLVVVVSPAAMRSELVRRNWRHFHNREKPILLVVYEPVERLPIGAKKLHRIQYNPGLPKGVFKQLIDGINTLKTKP
jgi:pSer/pThr/pTyr-binding forkhead associated (FHA) protein